MLLSVILPIHNTAAYLPDCIESVINQGLECNEFEIILVENASTDNSLEVCNTLKEKYVKNHITVIHTNTPGVGNARNLGIEASTGEYIHFIDSDDWIEKGMYSFLLSESVSDYYDLLITGIKNDYEGTSYIKEELPSTSIVCKGKEQLSDFLLQLDSKQKVWTLNVIWNKWYKAEIIKKFDIRFRTDINLGEDFVFNCAFFECMKTLKIASISFYHYMHRGDITLVNKFRTDILYRRPIISGGFFQNLLEGKLLFGSLYTVFNKDCKMTYRRKLDFIKEICESDYFSLLGKLYLKSSHMLYHKILDKAIFHYKNYMIVNGMLYLRIRMKRIK